MPRLKEVRSGDCDLNHKLANFAFLGTSLTGATFENQDVWITHCGFPAPEFNSVFLKRPGTRTAQAIQTGERFFADLSLPFKFFCRSDRASDCAETLAASGYERRSETPAIVLPVIPDEPSKLPDRAGDFDVSVVEAEGELETFSGSRWMDLASRARSEKSSSPRNSRLCRMCVFYVGRVGGEAVTTSALFARPHEVRRLIDRHSIVIHSTNQERPT